MHQRQSLYPTYPHNTFDIINIYIHRYTHTHTHMCVCVCVCVCVCIHNQTHFIYLEFNINVTNFSPSEVLLAPPTILDVAFVPRPEGMCLLCCI